MKKTLEWIAKIGNTVNETVGRLASWLTLILVLVVAIEVLRRYLFNTSSVWVGELTWHLFALIFLLGAGYGLKHDRHVRVDLFYARYSKRDQALTNALGGVLFLVPWCVLLIIVSWVYAQGSFAISEGSSNPNGLPFRYIIKFAIPFGLSLLLLQALANISEALLTLLYKKTS